MYQHLFLDLFTVSNPIACSDGHYFFKSVKLLSVVTMTTLSYQVISRFESVEASLKIKNDMINLVAPSACPQGTHTGSHYSTAHCVIVFMIYLLSNLAHHLYFAYENLTLFSKQD